MISATQQEFRNVVAMAVGEPLKVAGFRKSGFNYFRPLDQITHIVQVQRSIYNTADEVEFTINASVFVPYVDWAYAGYSDPLKPTEPSSAVRERIGFLCDERPDDYWWTVSNKSDDAELLFLVSDIRGRIERDVLPFLEQFKTAIDVADHLVHGERTGQTDIVSHSFAAYIFLKSGLTHQGRQQLERAVALAWKSPAEAHVLSYRDRLLIEFGG